MDNIFDDIDMINEFKPRTKRLSFLARRYKKRSFLDKDYDLLESRTIYQKPKIEKQERCLSLIVRAKRLSFYKLYY